MRQENTIAEAVKTCIQIANDEFSPISQRTMLQVASYGRAFCDDIDKDLISDTCKQLRVLNSIRCFDVWHSQSINYS